MKTPRKVPQPHARIVQIGGEPIPGAPTKDFYQYLLELDALVRDQTAQIADLQARVTDLETP